MNLKRFEDLTFQDDFIFGCVMHEKKLCKRLLEIILGLKIRDIKYLEEQKTINLSVVGKSVRLDVYVEDDQRTIYNVEMQTTNPKNLPERSRYYLGLIDLNNLMKGEDYRELKKTIIVFICPEDIFGRGRSIYTFKNFCVQEKDLELGDGAIKIFLNAKGTKGEVSPELRAFLDYVKDGRVSDTYTQELDNAVLKGKSSEEWRLDYMKLLANYMDIRRESHEEGREEGRFEKALEDIKKIMRKLKLSEDDAMDTLEIPMEERDSYRKFLNK